VCALAVGGNSAQAQIKWAIIFDDMI